MARQHLRYTSDEQPGFQRVRKGSGFQYQDRHGRPLAAVTIRRIESLAIPPAWTDVWIAPSPRGHLQATGRDARGRKQYLYHPHWTALRQAGKGEQLLRFAAALPGLRRRVARDLRGRGLGRERVLATVVRLLETTLIRVGNSQYARDNQSYGLTTLRNRHARIRGARVLLQFRGKSSQHHVVQLTEPRLARIVRRCQELPGQELFQYLDEQNEPHAVRSDDVNEYLQSISRVTITAKDYRMWAGTVAALRLLRPLPPGDSVAERKRQITTVVKAVAKELRNTPAVCRSSYIHPFVFETWQNGRAARRRWRGRVRPGLKTVERRLYRMLRGHQGR